MEPMTGLAAKALLMTSGAKEPGGWQSQTPGEIDTNR